MSLEEELKEVDHAINANTEDRAALKDMLASRGWKVYSKIIEAQKVTRENAILLMPLEDTSKVCVQEYMKGEAAAFRLVLAMPQNLVEAINMQLEQLADDRQNLQGDGK
jgi:hypothetical protein